MPKRVRYLGEPKFELRRVETEAMRKYVQRIREINAELQHPERDVPAPNFDLRELRTLFSQKPRAGTVQNPVMDKDGRQVRVFPKNADGLWLAEKKVLDKYVFRFTGNVMPDGSPEYICSGLEQNDVDALIHLTAMGRICYEVMADENAGEMLVDLLKRAQDSGQLGQIKKKDRRGGWRGGPKKDRVETEVETEVEVVP